MGEQVPTRELRAYMAHDGEPEDGAVLVFAHSVQEARRLAFPAVSSFTGCDFIHVRARWLRGGCSHLRQGDSPHVVESPPHCTDCELWYEKPLIDGLCEACAEKWKRWPMTDPQVPTREQYEAYRDALEENAKADGYDHESSDYTIAARAALDALVLPLVDAHVAPDRLRERLEKLAEKWERTAKHWPHSEGARHYCAIDLRAALVVTAPDPRPEEPTS